MCSAELKPSSFHLSLLMIINLSPTVVGICIDEGATVTLELALFSESWGDAGPRAYRW